MCERDEGAPNGNTASQRLAGCRLGAFPFSTNIITNRGTEDFNAAAPEYAAVHYTFLKAESRVERGKNRVRKEGNFQLGRGFFFRRRKYVGVATLHEQLATRLDIVDR